MVDDKDLRIERFKGSRIRLKCLNYKSIARKQILESFIPILNPVPDKLEALVKSEKTVSLEVRIVSGDNVEIEKIDGRQYP